LVVRAEDCVEIAAYNGALEEVEDFLVAVVHTQHQDERRYRNDSGGSRTSTQP